MCWEEIPGSLYFENGELNVDIVLLDGSNVTPKMSIKTGIVEINSIQQGDRIVVEEMLSGTRDEVAVVKNFTWNDLQRLGPTNLTFAPEYMSLNVNLRDAVTETIIFSLSQQVPRDQRTQRTNDVMASVISDNTYTNFQSNTNGYCSLALMFSE